MSVFSYAYSAHYQPAAPVAEIEVMGVGSRGAPVTLTTLLDSGADATILPIDILRTVGASYVETMHMQGVTGIRVPVDLYLVRVQIGPHNVGAVRAVAGARHGEAILGRDVLNQLVVTLNGPANVTELAG